MLVDLEPCTDDLALWVVASAADAGILDPAVMVPALDAGGVLHGHSNCEDADTSDLTVLPAGTLGGRSLHQCTLRVTGPLLDVVGPLLAQVPALHWVELAREVTGLVPNVEDGPELDAPHWVALWRPHAAQRLLEDAAVVPFPAALTETVTALRAQLAELAGAPSSAEDRARAADVAREYLRGCYADTPELATDEAVFHWVKALDSRLCAVAADAVAAFLRGHDEDPLVWVLTAEPSSWHAYTTLLSGARELFTLTAFSTTDGVAPGLTRQTWPVVTWQSDDGDSAYLRSRAGLRVAQVPLSVLLMLEQVSQEHLAVFVTDRADVSAADVLVAARAADTSAQPFVDWDALLTAAHAANQDG